MTTIRYEMRLPLEAAAVLEEMAWQRGVSRAAVLREAIGVLSAAERRGPGEYVGISSDRQALKTVLMGAK